MVNQVDAVRTALGADWAEISVRPVLCFVDSDWGWSASPLELNGVLVAWPKAARERFVASIPPEGAPALAYRSSQSAQPTATAWRAWMRWYSRISWVRASGSSRVSESILPSDSGTGSSTPSSLQMACSTCRVSSRSA